MLDHCRGQGVEAALSEGYLKGGDGMTDLRRSRRRGRAAGQQPDQVQPIYTADQSLEEKIHHDCDHGLRRGGVAFKPAAKARLQRISALGYQRLPVCIAKTQYSFSDDPTVMGAPWTGRSPSATSRCRPAPGSSWRLPGSMMLMPGLGKVPQAQKLDVDDDGQRHRDGVLRQERAWNT